MPGTIPPTFECGPIISLQFWELFRKSEKRQRHIMAHLGEPGTQSVEEEKTYSLDFRREIAEERVNCPLEELLLVFSLHVASDNTEVKQSIAITFVEKGEISGFFWKGFRAFKDTKDMAKKARHELEG
jgi:hypothetical protein